MKVKIITVIVMLIIMFGYSIAYYSSAGSKTITVESKERVNKRDSSKYLIFCKGETLENTDSWLFFKFSSSDVYRELIPGKTYNVKVAGWRVPFLSMYENIIKINK